MLAQVKQYHANRPYLADFTVTGDDNNIVITGYRRMKTIQFIHEGDSMVARCIDSLVDGRGELYDVNVLIDHISNDGEVWTHTGQQENTNEMLDCFINKHGLCVTEDTAKKIARLIGKDAIEILWEGTGQWELRGRKATFIMQNSIIQMSFDSSGLQVYTKDVPYGRFYSYNKYEECIVELTQTPTIDMFINMLIAQRDKLRAEYPAMAARGYPIHVGLYGYMSHPAHAPCKKINQISWRIDTTAAVNAALPQPIAEEIIDAIHAE